MKIKITALLFFFPISFYGQVLATKLIGNNKDSTVRDIKIVKFSPLWRDFDKPLNILAEDNENTDNLFELNPKISKPIVLSLMVLGKTESIFIMPGDQITFSIIRQNNRPKFVFYGKNAPHYSYSGLSDEYIESNQARPLFDKEKGLTAYKLIADNWLNLKLQFLSNYKLSSIVSDLFFEYSKHEIEYEYIQLLYGPLNSRTVELKDIPKDYFALADTFFNKNNYTLKHVTRNSLLAFTYKYILYNGENFIENFDSVYENISRQFKGETRSYLITNLIGIYAKEQSDIYRSSLLKVINDAPKFIHDPLILNYIERQEVEYTKLNRFFPDEILNTTYVKKINSDTKISLNDLLMQYKGEAIYLDFWASWCTPCREDIATSTMAKEFLKSKAVKYIYISLDTEAHESKWGKASIEDKITEDQYILVNDFKAPLSKYLKITSIPRYILLNKEHKVKSIDAPRPNLYQLNKLKTKVLYGI